jgi:hypothetical protein
MSDFCKIETILKEKLETSKSDFLWANYISTRTYLFENIYPEIKAILPNYTYHDGSHVINVLDNIYQLLDDAINSMTCEFLYFLCLSTLFHDVGLIYGRDEHQKKISDIFNVIHGKENIQRFANEKIIVTKTVEAHSGKSIDNTNDTLEYLGNLSGYFGSINTQEIAAILKFSDELAEGGQRTSDYFIEKGMYKKESSIFHRYAKAYHSVISAIDKRVVISYNIFFSINDISELIIDQEITLECFLGFIFERIIKIDDERKYCRYYCHWLDSMKEISVSFNFWYDGDRIEIGLNPIIISDKIIPGDSGREIIKLYPYYNYSNIDNIIRKNIEIKTKETQS